MVEIEDKIKRIKYLTTALNQASSLYYNGKESGWTDQEWDYLFDELKALENETGFSLPNSPTKRVGAPVLDKINKATLSHDMLSLKKVYSIQEVIDFADGQSLVASVKCDGLSLSLSYMDGILIAATTRGDGHIGSNVVSAVRYFDNIPQKIDKKGIYTIDGEAVIFEDDFQKINSQLSEPDRYSHSRNLAAGTLSLLDMNIVKQRHMKFIAWDVIEGDDDDSICSRLDNAMCLGFDTVPRCKFNDNNLIEGIIKAKFIQAEEIGLGCDGVVFKYDSKSYGDKKGKTSHHFNNGVAFKKKNEEVKTVLESVEWNTSKTGLINPVAVFKEVDLGGALTTRATLHNLSYIKGLKLGIGDTITVARKNEVIPKVMNNLTRSNNLQIPDKCPCCGSKAVVENMNGSMTLHCTNDECPAVFSAKMIHFCSKNAINVEDMSDATIEFLVDKKHWVTKFADIFNLEQYKEEWMKCEGFGKKSVEKLLENIEKARHTTLCRFLYGLSIPLFGKTACKTIASYFDDMVSKNGEYYNNPFDCFMDPFINNVDYTYWTKFTDFGEKMAHSISSYMSEHIQDVVDLASNFTFESAISSTAQSAKNEKIADHVFVITGSLEHFKNRDELIKVITDNGGKVSGSVSAKTSYLINNNVSSNSGKNKKAREIGIPVISEQEFINMIS